MYNYIKGFSTVTPESDQPPMYMYYQIYQVRTNRSYIQ